MRKILLSCLLSLGTAVGTAVTDHLVLSEVLINCPGTETGELSSEYTEIYNPTNTTVSLTNYYICDSNRYVDLVTTPTGFDLGSTADTILRFPTGSEIPPKGVAVVVQSAEQLAIQYFSSDVNGYFSQAGSPQLFEVVSSSTLAADMTVLNTQPGGTTTFSKTNGGEFQLLFYWDGVSDTVQDVDLVVWGSVSTPPTGGDHFTLKTASVLKDGPDVDTATTAYKVDAGPRANLVVNIPSSPATAPTVIYRELSNELSETKVNGNGITGNDESTEQNMTTWASSTSSNAATPGTSPLTSEVSSAKEWQSFE